MTRILFHFVIIFGLTILTQIGGLAWIAALFFRWKMLTFLLTYAALTMATIWVAPNFGRVALDCFDDGALQVQSLMYCALNRNYVSPELAEVLTDTANAMNDRFPDTATLVLDANFPFIDGFPLLPHLSHDDGEKVDLAFYYKQEEQYLKSATRSPIGYFAFEQGQTDCIPKWPTLRWDFDILQQLWYSYTLDKERNRALLQILSNEEQVGKIFVEPHLVKSLDVAHPKIRFQGCRAARHDDHIHLQLK